MPSFLFWQRWLLGVAVVIVVFGAALALLSGTPLFALVDQLVNTVFWNGQNPPDPARAFQQWIYGVLGGTMAGWGVFLLFIAAYPFKVRERWAWNCLLVGVALWFVLDTLVSLHFRAYFNGVLNTIILVAVLLPLALTRRDFTAAIHKG